SERNKHLRFVENFLVVLLRSAVELAAQKEVARHSHRARECTTRGSAVEGVSRPLPGASDGESLDASAPESEPPSPRFRTRDSRDWREGVPSQSIRASWQKV